MFEFIKKNKKITIDNVPEEMSLSNERIALKKNYITEVLHHKKLPIVLLDPLWHAIRKQIQNQSIKQNENTLQELLKEQGRLNNDYKEYNKVKQNFLKEILNISGQIQDDGDARKIAELNKLHQSTLSANQKIETIEVRIQEVEKEIEEVNEELVKEMLAIGYEYIDRAKTKQVELENEINSLREQMLKKTAEKKQSESFSKDIYNYMHNIVGRQEVETLDKALWENKK